MEGNIGITRSTYRTEGFVLDTYHATTGTLVTNAIYPIGRVVALNADGNWEKYNSATHDLSVDVSVDFLGETVTTTVVDNAVLGIMKDTVDTTGADPLSLSGAILVSGRVRKSDIVNINDDLVARLYKSGIYCE